MFSTDFSQQMGGTSVKASNPSLSFCVINKSLQKHLVKVIKVSFQLNLIHRFEKKTAANKMLIGETVIACVNDIYLLRE